MFAGFIIFIFIHHIMVDKNILLYGTEVFPTNAADLQSMQLTINRVIIKLFGTMSQNYYQEVSNYFGINTVKELVHNRFGKFRISYTVRRTTTYAV